MIHVLTYSVQQYCLVIKYHTLTFFVVAEIVFFSYFQYIIQISIKMITSKGLRFPLHSEAKNMEDYVYTDFQ